MSYDKSDCRTGKEQKLMVGAATTTPEFPGQTEAVTEAGQIAWAYLTTRHDYVIADAAKLAHQMDEDAVVRARENKLDRLRKTLDALEDGESLDDIVFGLGITRAEAAKYISVAVLIGSIAN